VVVAAAAAAGAALALVVRDQMHRHRRDLFSSNGIRRLAALGYMAKERPSVDNITLLRDFTAREPNRLLRARANAIVQRMERAVLAGSIPEKITGS